MRINIYMLCFLFSSSVKLKRQRDLIQSEVSQKEKHQYSILTHIYGIYTAILKMDNQDFPGGPVVKNLPCKAGDAG